jgi:hypothetical protein
MQEARANIKIQRLGSIIPREFTVILPPLVLSVM